MKIQVSDYEFTLSDRYASGSVVNEAEAKALNVERGERIRNFVQRRLNKLHLEPGTILTGEARADLYAHVARLDESFEFESRERTKPKVGTLEAEIREVAGEEARASARATGRENDAALVEQLFDGLLGDSRIELMAAQRLEARKQVALAGIDEL